MKSILLAIAFLFLSASVVFADGNPSNSGNLENPLQDSVDKISSSLTDHINNSNGVFDMLAHDLFWTEISIIFGAISGFLLVMLTERFKVPSARIELFPTLVLPDGRKFLKVKVVVFTNKWQKKFFPWQNPAFVGKLKGHVISVQNGKEVIEKSFTVKWDANPEPWDYQNNRVRPELLPAASQPQNFLPDDEDSAAVVVKHPNDSHFYIYDANYYVNRAGNQRSEREIILRLTFSSSSATVKKDFLIRNRTMNAFRLDTPPVG